MIVEELWIREEAAKIVDELSNMADEIPEIIGESARCSRGLCGLSRNSEVPKFRERSTKISDEL